MQDEVRSRWIETGGRPAPLGIGPMPGEARRPLEGPGPTVSARNKIQKLSIRALEFRHPAESWRAVSDSEWPPWQWPWPGVRLGVSGGVRLGLSLTNGDLCRSDPACRSHGDYQLCMRALFEAPGPRPPGLADPRAILTDTQCDSDGPAGLGLRVLVTRSTNSEFKSNVDLSILRLASAWVSFLP